MHDWLAARAAQDPSGLSLVADGHRVSFAELDEQAGRAAGALVDAGVKHGSRVALWGAHDLATVRAIWAVPRAGAVLLPINTRLTQTGSCSSGCRRRCFSGSRSQRSTGVGRPIFGPRRTGRRTALSR